jgi:hypothetical protein
VQDLQGKNRVTDNICDSQILSITFLNWKSHKHNIFIRREEKKKEKKNMESHRSSDDNTTCTIKKIFDEINSTTLNKITNSERSGSLMWSKGVEVHMFWSVYKVHSIHRL